MPQAKYVGPARAYNIGKYKFTRGGSAIDVDEDTAAHLRGEPQFEIDGKRGVERAPVDDETSDAPAPPSGPQLPAHGFESKHDAIAFAKEHFGVELSSGKAIKTLNAEVEKLYFEKFPQAKPEETEGAVTV